MPAMKKLYGERFGRLLVVDQSGRSSDGKVIWACLCDCGSTAKARSTDLLQGKILSCGCLHSENLSARNMTHGMSQSNTYFVWSGMIQRCSNPNNHHFKYYGARGITVCDEWLKFEKFISDMGEAPIGMSIERKRVNEGYSKDNCKWATTTEQANNKTNNVLVSVDGVLMTAAQAENAIGVKASKIRRRIRRGNNSSRAIIDADLRTMPYRLDDNHKFIKAD